MVAGRVEEGARLHLQSAGEGARSFIFFYFFFSISFPFFFFPAPRGGHGMNNLRVINVLCNSSRLDQGHGEESSGNVCG